MNNQLTQKLMDVAPIVAFFSMSAALQIDVMPTVEEKKYDFPDGDLISNNTLEILLCIYLSMLNSISLEILVVNEEAIDQNIESIRGLITLLCKLAHLLFNDYDEVLLNADSLESIEWDTLRHLSSLFQQIVGLHTVTNRNALEEEIESWVHP